jgi:hypothetical protein
MPRISKPVLVSRDWLKQKVEENPSRTIGRALVAIFRKQTTDERINNSTKLHNGVGFSANDARLGCIGAKYYLKHGKLSDGLMKGWLKPDKRGYPRIVKYVRQLNEIAINLQQNNEVHNGIHTRVP